MSLRIYLTGRPAIECGGAHIAARFPGRQGRRALVYLLLHRDRPVPREELAEAVWQDVLPPAWDVALSALISKLRRLLAGCERDGTATVNTDSGCYELRLPPDTWMDAEAAAAAVEEAEAALRSTAPASAWGPANVAVAIARRPLLAGEDGAWIERARDALHRTLIRGLDCLTEVSLVIGDLVGAAQAAADAVTLEPYRETGYLRLMRAHSAAGNRAEALRVYQRCRALLAEELGVDPSAAVESLYLELLRA